MKGIRARLTPSDLELIEQRGENIASITPILYEKARKPAYVLKIDFGEKIGIKTSSAQITNYYKTSELINKQIMAVCNFPPRNVAGINSEVLVLGAIEEDGKVVIFHPSQKVKNGLIIA